MDQLVKVRGPIRRRLTRLINESKAEMQNQVPDQRLLQAKLLLLTETEEQLEEHNQKILDQMLDDDATDEEQDQEIQAIDKYKESYLGMKYDIEKLLQPTEGSPAASEYDTASTDVGSTNRKRNFKLPKVELRKFNGDLKNWLGWWSQFSKIHEDEDLHKTDKFQYLSQCMEPGTDAKELVDSYPQSEENYEKAVEALQQRFGRQDLLLQVYVRELLTLVISNVTNKERVPLSGLYYKLESHLRSLSALNLDKADPATWLFPLVESSLSEDTLRAWQRSTQSKVDCSLLVPKKTRLDQLMDFIKLEVQSEQQIDLAKTGFHTSESGRKPNNGKHQKAQKNKESEDIPTAAGLVNAQNPNACCFCDNKHDSDRCVKAISMSLEDRRVKLKNKGLCYQFMKPGHSANKCRAVVKCVLCNGKHYPILCPKGSSQQRNPNKPDKENEAPAKNNSDKFQSASSFPSQSNMPAYGDYTSSASHSNQCSSDVLLNTLKVQIVTGSRPVTVRLVGDTGSQRSYVQRNVVTRSGCPKTGDEWLQNILFGGGVTTPTRHGKFMVTLSSMDGKKQGNFELLEQDRICGQLPYGPWMEELDLMGISVTDQGEGCHDVQVLLGNDYWGSILTGRMEKLRCGLVATETIFGWTVGGRVPRQATSMAVAVTSLLASSTDITNLWSLESIGVRDPIEVRSCEDEEKEALQQFAKTVNRDPDGRYVVGLPWKLESVNVPTNLGMAIKRVRSATYKLKREGKLENYAEVFESWEKEGLIETVESQDVGHYLPHRPVFKESATTPVRPVFDASAKIGNKYSLNECLHKGPNLLELIPSLLLRFRERKVGVTADIRKAFQMLRVREDDQHYQKFLWWEDMSCNKMKVFKHKRVVFGMNCSPFLLGATINHHLKQVEGDMRSTADKLNTSFYVDNCVTSVDSFEEYNRFRIDATRIMGEAKMELREWAYAEEGINTILAKTFDGIPAGSEIQTDLNISVLGMHWARGEDQLFCAVKPCDVSGKITKRSILSVISQIFDPLGMMSPVTLLPKLIIQQSWSQKIGWDEEVPEDVKKKFMTWALEAHLLRRIGLMRHMQLKGTCHREVHIFCDASRYCYATVAFMRSQIDDEVKVSFLMAKSRLAPMKRCTIPRLELMACLIGTRLARVVKGAIKTDDVPFHYWSDSSTAIAWIRRAGEFGLFVTNRCQEIRTVSDPEQWAHVPGIFNPADLPSRGCSPRKLLESSWWEGPNWLRLPKRAWPISAEKINEEEVAQERRKTQVLVAAQIPATPRFSSYRSNIAIWGWVLRFLHNSKKSNSKKTGSHLSVAEMRKAEIIILRDIQRDAFASDTTKIGGLLVRMDETGLLRVQTKLTNRKDKKNFLSPVVLPKQHPLVDLLIQDLHRHFGHAGIQFLMGKLREKYWVIQSRRVIRRIIHRCVICRRHTAKPSGVEPSALPEGRVKNSEPFETTGVDLAGPLFIRDGQKVWVVLFTCAVFRCVYLDVVTSLSTEAFMNSLERFIGIYGRPNTVYSDNGTNFVGTVNIFKTLNWNEIEEASHVRQIQWKLNPPASPWYGGFFERLVRSLKDALKRMLGKSRISFDQLRTCLAGVSATINDRPLTVVTEDNNDLIPLTPSMFLRRRISGHLPETLSAQALQQGYHKMKQIQGQLQDRFRREYLAQLVMRKNDLKILPIAKGDVVLVGADNRKRFEWPLGVVEDLIPGKDGKVRVARVRTANGHLIRPMQRLYPLELSTKADIPSSAEIVKSKVKAPAEEPEVPVVTRKGRVVQRPRRYGQWLHLVKD